MTTPAVDHRNLPYRVAVLCYLYDADGNVLLLHRRKDPNAGMYSPVGGKVEVEHGESPHACAIREVREETGIRLADADVQLSGVVSEKAYNGNAHWLIFLFEVLRPIAPGEMTHTEFDEGTLEWIPVAEVPGLEIPESDREVMWPLVQEHRGGFFMVHIDCSRRPKVWTLQESIKGRMHDRARGDETARPMPGD